MKRKAVLKRLMLVSAFSVLIIGIILIQPAKAIVVIDDHFDDEVLDPAWSINFQDATGWTFSESGTNLTVTDIDPVVSGGTMADVILSRNFTPLTDFHAEFGFSWDSEGSTLPMQLLFISLYGPNDNLISEVSYFDAWIGARGGVYGSAKNDEPDEPYDSYSLTEQLFLIQSGGNYYFTNWNYLDYAGTASIDII